MRAKTTSTTPLPARCSRHYKSLIVKAVRRRASQSESLSELWQAALKTAKGRPDHPTPFPLPVPPPAPKSTATTLMHQPRGEEEREEDGGRGEEKRRGGKERGDQNPSA